ncbi:fibrous sheath CABYR-binding protein [Neocloeon triangulifer]|uniref:fibrous sheath CABYR-binding protein n=1 Tax=Neocloeon triangulifer TaxID=2078957 RepID=UPI00286FA1C6|nr:fibrous sheath CABYR-binding protein [Neocloeon triangulifer]
MFESNSPEEFQVVLAWVISFSVFIMLVAFFGCVCGCKKKNSEKDEWIGKEGKLKPLNNLDDDILPATDESQKAANRASTANRSLPDIPVNEVRDANPTWDANQLTITSDNCSGLYATVGENSSLETETKAKKRQAPSVPNPGNSAGDSASGNLKSSMHQYAKLSHPYARVKPPPPKNDAQALSSIATQPSIEFDSSETTPGTLEGSETTLSSSTDQPIPPPRTRRSSSQSNLFYPSNTPPLASGARSANTLPSYPSNSSSILMPDSIPAGPAIMGKISASQELPYITLPLDNILRHNSVPADLQNHAVEEENANGVDEANNAAQEEADQRNQGAGHFSGDSQDSSKGYTSISVREPLASIRAQTAGQLSRRTDPHYATVSDDSDEMYAAIEDRTGSDTYAQIVPLPQQQPPPPSVDSLRSTVAENHSRQASSSSASSAAVVVGSPKPEKRQANSPLPPPPAVPPPNISPPPTPTTLPQSKLDEMYAKVNKKKNSKEGPQVVAKEGTSRDSTVQINFDLNSGYESLPSNRPPSMEPNYESMSSNILDTDSASGYAVVAPKKTDYASYGSTRQRNSLHQPIDPNYEELGLNRDPSSVQEPNYEMLNGEPNYEPLKSVSSTQDDPNYESVLSLQEPPYEQLNQTSDSAGDILYATVNKTSKAT